MRTALFGHTGFVGSNLARQYSFSDHFNSVNSECSRGAEFDLVVFSAARAEKWRANADPAADWEHIQKLTELVSSFRADRFVLISTVDVYGDAVDVDEHTTIDESDLSAYGLHRLQLEQAVREAHPLASILRLPGLYGEGLKKNVIFDLMNHNLVDKINPDSTFQFYGVHRLWSDVGTALGSGCTLVNLSTHPVQVGEVARQVFDRNLPRNETQSPAAHYDMRSVHAETFGGSKGYLESADEVMAGLRRFVLTGDS